MSAKITPPENCDLETEEHLFLPTIGKEHCLKSENETLKKINLTLMRRIERSFDYHSNGFALFQSAIRLEELVRQRTEELRQALTTLEQTNQELEKAKEHAEYLNNTKTKFLAAASHDLLQPLNAAKLSLSSLSQGEYPEQLNPLVVRLGRSLSSLDELLRTLFDISKLDAGVSQPNIVTLSAPKLVQSLRSDFAAIAREKGLKFKSFCHDEFLLTDPIYLRRILQNLLSNAVRYTSIGGVLIGTRKRGNMLNFEIWDTGDGINETEREKIFEEFHRGMNTAGQEGLGLGLSIVKRMANVLEHPVSFQSVKNKGTRFSVSVPIVKTPAQTPKKVKFVNPQNSLINNSYIALVEDDHDTLQAMEYILSKWGAMVISANSGKKMLELTDEMERIPDLIIADFHLERGMCGADIVRGICQKLNAQIPSIIVSSEPSNDVIKRAEASGAEFMPKPTEPAELRALINHLLRQQEEKD